MVGLQLAREIEACHSSTFCLEFMSIRSAAFGKTWTTSDVKLPSKSFNSCTAMVGAARLNPGNSWMEISSNGASGSKLRSLL